MVKAQREMTCTADALQQERDSLGVEWFPDGRAASNAEMRRIQNYVSGTGARGEQRLFQYLSVLAGFSYQADFSNDQFLRSRFDGFIFAHAAPAVNHASPNLMTQIFLCMQAQLLASMLEQGNTEYVKALGQTLAGHYAQLSLEHSVTDWPLIRALRNARAAPQGINDAIRDLTAAALVRADALQRIDSFRAARMFAEAAAGRAALGDGAETVATGAQAIANAPANLKGPLSWAAFPAMYDGLKITESEQPPTAAAYTNQIFSMYNYPDTGPDLEREFEVYLRFAKLFRELDMDNTDFWVLCYNVLRRMNADVGSHAFFRQGLKELAALTDTPVEMLLGTRTMEALHPSPLVRAQQLYDLLLSERQQTVVMDSKSHYLLSYMTESILHSLSRMQPQNAREQAAIAELAFKTLQLDSFTRLSVAAASTGIRRIDMPRERRFHLERFYTYSADHSAWLDATGLRVAVMPGQPMPSAQDLVNAFMTISTFQNETEAELPRYYEVLRQQAPDVYAMTVPYSMSLADFQRRLGDNEAVVASVLGTGESYMFVVRNNALAFARSELSAAEFADAVATLRASVAASGGGDSLTVPAYEAAVAHDLYNESIGKVVGGLEGANHVYWYGDGALGAVPPAILVSRPPGKATMTALADFNATRFLVDDYSLSSVPDLYLGKTEFLKPDSSAGAPETFAGFGAPLLSNEELAQDTLASSFELAGGVPVTDLGSLAKLPAAKTELESLSGIFDSPAIWLGEEASEARVRETDLSGYDVLAFATHGFTRSDIQGQIYPSLLMSPPDEAVNSANDGLLTTLEIGRLQLDADLVLLSACNTATSDGRPDAEAFSGLAQAFLVAGARSLLVSHWPVASGAASELSVQTVSNWKGGDSLSGSLQSSIQSLRSAATTDLEAHPFFWGPFVLANDGGR